MIKKLSFKFVLVFLVLVVSIFITSTCYAFSTAILSDISNSPYSLEQVNQILTDNGYGEYVNYKKIFISSKYQSTVHTFYVYIPLSSDLSYLKQYDTSLHKINFYNSNNEVITISYLRLRMDAKSNTFKDIEIWENYNNFSMTTSGYTNYVYYSDYDLYDISGNLFYESVISYINVTHEFQSDTSAKVNFVLNNVPEGAYLQYSLTGVEISTDLDAPVKLRNPITYTPRSNKFNC